jgi:two-component system, OmpR family, heavy metal sensor histidine kinase CusS
MRTKTIKFKVCLLYVFILGVVLSIYIGIFFLLPGRILQGNKLPFILLPIPLTLLFGYFIGYLIISRILKPIKIMTDTVKNITHEDLSLRLKTENVDEELGRLIEAFNDMILRLSESFEYITDSSSYIAHELKTPIAIIRGESEFALKKEREKEEYKRVISVSLEETKRMLKIIEDLLLLTRMNYQPDVLKFEPVDLTEFIRVIYEQAKVLALKKDIVVKLAVPQESRMVNADELHLRRLFFNLIDNAIKFTFTGGSITMQLIYEGQKAFVSIIDTGIGIKEENLPKLFDKFFRIDTIIKDTSPSSGLGLSIAQSIAQLHKGEIAVTGSSEQGTNFTVSLPIF